MSDLRTVFAVGFRSHDGSVVAVSSDTNMSREKAQKKRDEYNQEREGQRVQYILLSRQISDWEEVTDEAD